jgi:acetoin utilization protein AcuB
VFAEEVEPMLVKYWMKQAVVTVDANDSMQEAMGRLKEQKASLLPVMENGKLVGVVTDRDLKKASASDAAVLEAYELAYLLTKIKVRDIMTKSPVTVAADYTLEEAAWLLMTNDISGAPVKDDDDRVVGIISRTEIFLALISLTGLANRGIQLALRVEDRPGSIKEVTDIVRSSGGRLVSLLTSYERAPTGYRHVYVRACRVDRTVLSQMLEQLRQKALLLYMVDHRENLRVEYVDSSDPGTKVSPPDEITLRKPQRILYCTDFSENSIPARLRAVEYAKILRAELIIMHVLSSRLVGYPFFEEAVGDDIAELQQKLDDRVKVELEEVAKACGQDCAVVRTCVRSGVTANEIVRCADELSADLIVMGTHGWSGLKHLILGSTVENVLRMASCPVLIVRPAGRGKEAAEGPILHSVS